MSILVVLRGKDPDWPLVDPEPPHWWRVSLGSTERHSALLSCPKCGCIGGLSQHTIDPDGTVHPSVLMSCRHTDPCWHSESPGVRLEGWEP